MLKKNALIYSLLFLQVTHAWALDSISYSGRLVNANGSPVTGPVNLKFDLSYSNAPAVVICTKTLDTPPVPLSNGVFHVKLDFVAADCGGNSLLEVMAATPVGE